MCWFFSHHDVLSCCNAPVLADRWCMKVSRTGQWGVPSSGHTLASIDDFHTALASNGQPDDHRLLLHFLYITLTGWMGENLFPWLASPWVGAGYNRLGASGVSSAPHPDTSHGPRQGRVSTGPIVASRLPFKRGLFGVHMWPCSIHFGMVCPYKGHVLIACTTYTFALPTT
jgi:hypothetical protein